MYSLTITYSGPIEEPQLISEITAAAGVAPTAIERSVDKLTVTFDQQGIDADAVIAAILAHRPAVLHGTDMQNLRALRQMGRGAFMDLTAAERDRATYDALVSVTKVLLAILREEV